MALFYKPPLPLLWKRRGQCASIWQYADNSYSLLYYTHHTLWPMPKIQVHGRRNCSITDTVPRSSCLFPFYGLAFAFGHFFGKRIFPLFLDVTDASGAVGIEQKGEHLAYPIGKHLTFFYIMRTFGAGIELVFLTTRTDFTPGRLFISFASGAFPCQELAASSAIKTASGDVLSVRYDGFHRYQMLE